MPRENHIPLEVLDGIILGPPESTGLHQQKNHLTDVGAGTDAPMLQDKGSHRTEILECLIAESLEQFARADMTTMGSLLF